ncbi:MAG: IS630 family transposase [Porphyromonadaceae bacterium]|nr:MAG: IS630 family transposase [Porphyromonadaceae bacterium]
MNTYKVTLTKEERDQLTEITRTGTHAARKIIHALILLNVDRGTYNAEQQINEEVCKVLKIGMRTIDRVKKRFVEEGLEAALKMAPTSREYEKLVDGDMEAHLIALACGEPPKGYARWSLRLLADRLVELRIADNISYETVRRTPKKNELKPWKSIGWVIPAKENGEFVAAMEKVLDVYRRPYNPMRPVVCMDESPKQLIGETRVPIPMSKGHDRKCDYEYERLGVCNIFLANEPLAGFRTVKITEKKCKVDWAEFIKEIADEHYPEADLITLVMDNLGTHTPGAFYERYEPAEAKRILDRFEFVFTPKHGSWLDMAEIELNVLNNQCLGRRIDSIDKVREEVEAWKKARNGFDKKINWQFTKEKARIKLKRLYPSYES